MRSRTIAATVTACVILGVLSSLHHFSFTGHTLSTIQKLHSSLLDMIPQASDAKSSNSSGNASTPATDDDDDSYFCCGPSPGQCSESSGSAPGTRCNTGGLWGPPDGYPSEGDCVSSCFKMGAEVMGIDMPAYTTNPAMMYNITFVNHADMDAEVAACECGRGTDMCDDVDVVLKGGSKNITNLEWSQFRYPDGSICYSYLKIKMGSNNPPQPYFPYNACTLNNTDMGLIWEIGVHDHNLPRLTVTLPKGSQDYNCQLG
mmetsp:Transcript_35671/g.43002  ORF Transcript_35671/g.43002 Transcript_35671/m.43002 type:complete len:259 (-) Transcript_35671:510-1286(-)|eukprot:CAMPEP_0197860980 /NCGR_PEP_ID=MMETSP1438-20131217/36726_1 /TAXON_ID=1461541 /ORGANISM="Pterosperma sp., Strain CCMP1384" /LENGTH=258 /DNA_ID=CAMNT_0043478015 /DNA_START=149 /DNA_END=925 /DNA_ORIENTATION=+